jgi:protein-S-isoprenylcysteine O-methyltransferase Ste14
VLFALASASSDVMNPDNIDFLLIRNGALMVALIFALFVAFGVAMEATVRALDRRLPAGETGSRARAAYAAIAAIGLALVALILPLALFSSGFCSCDPPIVASAFALVAGAGTVLSWFARDRSATSSVMRVARALGYGGVAGTLAFGLARAIADASDIVGR